MKKTILTYLIFISFIFAQETQTIIEETEKHQTVNDLINDSNVKWNKSYTLAIKYSNAKIFYIHFNDFKSLKKFLREKNLRNDSNIETLKIVSKRTKKTEDENYSDLRVIEFNKKD